MTPITPFLSTPCSVSRVISRVREEIVVAVKKNADIARIYEWAVQFWIPTAAFTELLAIIPALRGQVAADHCTHTEIGSKEDWSFTTFDPYMANGFPEVIELVWRRLMFVKLSAPYQSCKQSLVYEESRITGQSLPDLGPDMVVYDSDWLDISNNEINADSDGWSVEQNYQDINGAALVEILKDWAGTERQMQCIFVDNL
ncbi:hypothetical protein GQ53DRAFT_823077 [Thozetella sp. PMI_491]|nr:hypothetical protein GQ53DRAFT_823077 [Thozetella sp. PMI_491]